ncbi:MAG: 2-C-methyl-D-erythritol 2,4-cyclodiphosphate synthase [Planctomycetota bacterium]
MTSSPNLAHPRIGHGFDLHRLVEGRDLVLANITIPSDHGCDAHSDGDVVFHALTDAILGALAQQDIGQLFPDNDPEWKDADSAVFIREAVSRMTTAGYTLGNADLTVILQTPKLSPHKPAMLARLVELLGCDDSQVNLKAKTHERVDALGQSQAVACHAVVILIPA